MPAEPGEGESGLESIEMGASQLNGSQLDEDKMGSKYDNWHPKPQNEPGNRDLKSPATDFSANK